MCEVWFNYKIHLYVKTSQVGYKYKAIIIMQTMVSLYIYMCDQPSWPPRILIIVQWCSAPGAEARGALWYILIGIMCYCYPPSYMLWSPYSPSPLRLRHPQQLMWTLLFHPPPVPITLLLPVTPYSDPPPDIVPISYKSRCIGKFCSGGKQCWSWLSLAPPP